MMITQSEKLFRNTIRIMISHVIGQCVHDSGKKILRKEESLGIFAVMNNFLILSS